MTHYRVSGAHAVLGNEPGTEFDAAITETQEARLIAAGALELVSSEAPPAPKGDPKE